jgi:probable HAF family extracellular repeat protein
MNYLPLPSLQNSKALPLASKFLGSLLIVAMSFVISAVAAPSRGVPTYSLTDVGSFNPVDGERSANGISFLGHVVGSEAINQIVRPFLYANRQDIDLTPLLPPLGGTSNAGGGYATAINIQDQVVGYLNSFNVRSFSPQSFVYKDGRLLIFGMPNSLWTRATSINNFGQIVGYFEGNADAALEHPFLRQPNGKMSDLGTFGGISAMASAINDRGQIAVNVDRADGTFHALVVHPGGTASNDLGSFTYANALNDLGQVVGSLQVSPLVITPVYTPAVYHAVLYSGGRIHDLGTLPGLESSSAYGVNSFGFVVGSAWGQGNQGGFIYLPGVGMRNLQDLTPGILRSFPNSTGAGPLEGYLISGAVGINDRGQIAADAYFFFLGDPFGHERAVILTPHSN